MTLCPADLSLPSKFQQFRRGQLSTALDIAAADKRWSLLQASTGSGKSLLDETVSKLLNVRTLTLTVTKQLQRQHLADFPYLALVEGSDNYRCGDAQRGRRTCAADDTVAVCRYRRQRRDDGPSQCPYVAAQQRAYDSDDTISNVAYWLALARHNPGALGVYGLLICDEAHNLLDWLTSACALEFAAAELRSISVDTPPSDGVWYSWSLGAIDAAVSAYRTASDRGASPQQLTTLTELGKRLRELSVSASGDSDVQWVGETVRERSGNVYKYVPVWPGERFAEAKLWRGVPRVVLSSATLTHEDAKHLGLRRDDYSFHELDAGFDPRRRPLYYLPVARIDKSTGEGEWRLTVNEFDRFIGARLKLGWRGVVQATSYDWAERVLSTSRHAAQMVTHRRGNSRERETVVSAFARMDGPPILVSPSVREGHDFIGPVARWQVIVKSPSPNTLSPVLAARCKSDSAYRYHLTGRTLEQQCGRSTRSADDFSEVLICDTHFSYLRGKPVFTKSFRSTWRNVDAVPAPLEL